jgi:hypothetical protein
MTLARTTRTLELGLPLTRLVGVLGMFVVVVILILPL